MQQPASFLKSVILFLVIWLSALPGFHSAAAVSFEYTPALHDAQRHLCELRLGEAENLIRAEELRKPDNLAAAYLSHYLSFYKILLQYDRKLLPAFEKLNATVRARCQALPESAPERGHLQGSLLLQSAIVKGTFGEYLSAAWDFRSAFLEVNGNEKKFPSYVGHKKELGALTAMIGSFPSQYHWIMHAVGLHGDYEQGLTILRNFLKVSKQEPQIEQQQAVLIYGLILLNFDTDKQRAWEFIRNVPADTRKNLMFAYVKGYIASRSGQNDAALEILRNRPDAPAYEPIPYLNIVMGTCLLHQLDPGGARLLKRYLATTVTKASMKEASMKLSWASWLEGDTLRFKTYHHAARKAGNSSELNWVNTDLEAGIYPSLPLLRCRLLTDGGYYERAFAELQQLRPEQLKSDGQRAEYHYRLGRLAQDRKRYNDAIDHYKRCIANPPAYSTYMLPNACLQLGLIYEQLRYPDLAVSYLKKVSDYSDYDYESSIEQKAKDALKRIGK